MDAVSYEELLEREVRVITHVVGQSMEPLLHDRASIVVVEAVRSCPPRRGDVVLYRTGGVYILHRVLRIEPERYIIRGDNTWILEYVPRAHVLGTMTAFYRRPEGRETLPKDPAYRLYCALLPLIRIARRIVGKLRRIWKRS